MVSCNAYCKTDASRSICKRANRAIKTIHQTNTFEQTHRNYQKHEYEKDIQRRVDSSFSRLMTLGLAKNEELEPLTEAGLKSKPIT